MKTIPLAKLKDPLIKIFWITVAWTIISIFRFFVGYNTVHSINCDLSDIDTMIFFKVSILTGVVAGILGGSLVVFLWEKWFRDKRYLTAIFYMFWSYSIIFVVVSVCTGLFLYFQGIGNAFERGSEQEASIFFNIESFENFVFWLLVVLATLIVLLVNDKYGPGVFTAFLLGKYFSPIREERIFMFLDLRSSTTIAEKLGEVRYFNFIREVFKDVTPAILSAKGEIYQYVGDEIVVSWKMENGLQDSNCIQCFFEAQSALIKKHDYYKEYFDGIQPEFKAGLHYGYVMAGEVGVVKREIAFSGDVLNTTARIQSKCNEHGVNILLSKYLLDKLKINSDIFHPKMVGDILLRGKQENVTLYTV